MNVQVKPTIPLNTGKPSELRDYIAMIERDHPKEILRIKEEIDPAKFEATAILANLEEAGINPMVVFEKPINQLGKVSPFPLITNIYSSRRRDALALGLKANQDRIELSPNMPAARRAGCRRCASRARMRRSSRSSRSAIRSTCASCRSCAITAWIRPPISTWRRSCAIPRWVITTSRSCA